MFIFVRYIITYVGKMYSDVEFSWEIHQLSNQNAPLQQVYLDWDVKILEGKLENADDLLADLRDIIHRQEERLVNHTKAGHSGGADSGTMLDRHHLTTRFKNYNVFYIDHPATEKLWEFQKEAYRQYLKMYDVTMPLEPSIQSWANVLRSGDEIGKHAHVGSVEATDYFMSTNVCVTADETTATVYDMPGFISNEVHFTNEPGQLIAFPPWIPHYTTPFEKDDSTRITIATDYSMANWRHNSFDEGKRKWHFVPFDEPPSAKARDDTKECRWEDVPSVDSTIAQLVNFSGELTEETLVEMKRQGTDFARERIVPDGVDFDEDEQ